MFFGSYGASLLARELFEREVWGRFFGFVRSWDANC